MVSQERFAAKREQAFITMSRRSHHNVPRSIGAWVGDRTCRAGKRQGEEDFGHARQRYFRRRQLSTHCGRNDLQVRVCNKGTMKAARTFPLLALTSVMACEPSQIIEGRPAFQNLQCELSQADFDQLKRTSRVFAETHHLGYNRQDYSVLLSDRHLNFILAKVPEQDIGFATAIARSEPKADEQALFARLISFLKLKCAPAKG